MKSAARAWRTVGKGCLRHDGWLRDAVLVVDAFWLNRRKLRKEAAPRGLCDGGAHRRPGEGRWHRARHGRWRVRRNAKHGVVDAAPVVGSSFVRRTSVRRSSQRLQRVIGRIDEWIRRILVRVALRSSAGRRVASRSVPKRCWPFPHSRQIRSCT
jgi:hypothetical protein